MFFLLLISLYYLCFFFFFSSRRRHTRCLSDWSSDVCSSDLLDSSNRARRRQRSSKPTNAHKSRGRDSCHRTGAVGANRSKNSYKPCSEQSREIGRASCRERV